MGKRINCDLDDGQEDGHFTYELRKLNRKIYKIIAINGIQVGHQYTKAHLNKIFVPRQKLIEF